MHARARAADGQPVGPVNLRDVVRDTDTQAVRDIVTSSGFFAPHEINVALELVEERLARGAASGYHFLFADVDGRPIGYACYGPIACTLGSFDLYWIAVHPDSRGRSIGRRLLAEVERRVAAAGGRRLYVETSSRELYAPTRSFYEHCGYVAEARLPNFYAPGDDKIIYTRPLGGDDAARSSGGASTRTDQGEG